MLDEVTVVAYGTKRKQDLVGSISSVKNEIISNSQAASVSNALEGAVAGLQVVSSSGQPGQDADIVLRGIGSISASNNALIVVDGVPFNGKLSDINPTDIASVNVSKDAVSNSLYGSRAAGGVVMITTKTGRKDKVSINFDGSWGVAQRAYKDYDMATDPGEFYRLIGTVFVIPIGQPETPLKILIWQPVRICWANWVITMLTLFRKENIW